MKEMRRGVGIPLPGRPSMGSGSVPFSKSNTEVWVQLGGKNNNSNVLLLETVNSCKQKWKIYVQTMKY